MALEPADVQHPEVGGAAVRALGQLGRVGTASHDELRAIVELAPVGIGIVGLDGRTILTNDALRRMLGYDAAEFASLHWASFTHPDDIAPNLELFAELVGGRRDHFELDKRFIAADGSTVWARLTTSLLRDEDGEPSLAIGIAENITGQRRLEQQLRTAEETFRLLVEESPGVVYVAGLDLTQAWPYISPRVEKLFGVDVDEWRARPTLWWERMDTRDRPGVEQRIATMATALDPGPHVLHYRIRRSDGEIRWVRDEFRLLAEADGGHVFRGVLHDVTREKELEEDLEHQATHDPLTGLANRTLFADRIADRLGSPTAVGHHHAVLLVDLDDFKTVNDSLGHAAGDELIRSVARRLATCLRPGDLAGRLGGDEFALLIEDLTDPVGAAVIASRLDASIGVPHHLDGITVTTSASIGIAYLDDAGSVEEVLRNADLAMYRAKQLGKGRVAAYEPALHEAAVRRLLIRSALEGALERGELEVHLQPIVDFDRLEMVSAEALLRWHHPEHGAVPPDDFIPIAEETGVIGPIGSWVLRTSCAWLAARHAEGRTDLTVEVNLSPVQLEEDGFVETVAEVLRETGLPASSLVLEITEQALISARSWFELGKLDVLGVQIAVDDFGTGYASLAYLSRLPADVLKIDRQFVAQLTGDRRTRAVPAAIVQLAHSLGLEVVAEGVETRAQWEALKTLGCGRGQGFLFARPVPMEVATTLLGQRLFDPAALSR